MKLFYVYNNLKVLKYRTNLIQMEFLSSECCLTYPTLNSMCFQKSICLIDINVFARDGQLLKQELCKNIRIILKKIC